MDTNKDLPVIEEDEHTTTTATINVTLDVSQAAQGEVEDAGGDKKNKKKTELAHSLLLILLAKKEGTARLKICMYFYLLIFLIFVFSNNFFVHQSKKLMRNG